MDFLQLVRSRHSVRSFRDKPVASEDLRAILEAMNAAPSAGDLQSYEVVVVTDPERRLELARAARQEFVAQAPVVLVFFMHPERSRAAYGLRGTRLYTFQDAAIAASYAQLAAHARGLGVVWVGAFEDDEVARAVNARDDLAPAAMLAIGYPAEIPEHTPRRPLDDLVHRERF